MELAGLDREPTDGVVILRRPAPSDRKVLIDARDAESRRFLGEGSPDPQPSAVIMDPDRRVVGWIDQDSERAWLGPGEVNVGYSTFPEHRGRGVAQRALALLLAVLADDDHCTTATVLIDPANHPSIAVARHAGFEPAGDIDGQLFFRRSVGT